MPGTVTLLDPTAPPRADVAAGGRALSGLAGKVMGFVDNAKPNFNYLVDDLAGLFAERYGVSRVVKRRKTSASIPAPADMIRELTKECDLVITGSGD